jgi:23S rRNA pseudouridine1911/1915/1917 synthase
VRALRIEGQHRVWVIGPEEAGERLDAALARRWSLSRSALRLALVARDLEVDGRPGRWGERLRAGSVVRIPRLERPEPEIAVGFRVLCADAWLVAVDKDPGAPVHPVRSFRTRTLLTALAAALDDPGLRPVHRLDRETSGLVVFGRSSEAARRLGEQFVRRSVEKRYLAVVRGEPEFERRSVELSLGRDPDFPVRCRMRVDERGGQPATTELRVLERRAGRALVEAVPRTGRQHQIRVHLAALGHPILGDKLYLDGGRAYLAQIGDRLDEAWLARLGHVRQALHAHRLRLVHPGTGAPLELEAPLPDDLRGLLDVDG